MMANMIFEKLETALDSGVMFGHSIEESARQFLQDLPEDAKDKVNILISGDKTCTNAHQISRQLSAILRYFELRDNFRILTGNLPGVESVVQRYARNSRIECVVLSCNQDENEGDYGALSLRSRNLALVEKAHVVILLNQPGSKFSDSMYQLARQNGRLVTRRYIGPKP